MNKFISGLHKFISGLLIGILISLITSKLYIGKTEDECSDIATQTDGCECGVWYHKICLKGARENLRCTADTRYVMIPVIILLGIVAHLVENFFRKTRTDAE